MYLMIQCFLPYLRAATSTFILSMVFAGDLSVRAQTLPSNGILPGASDQLDCNQSSIDYLNDPSLTEAEKLQRTKRDPDSNIERVIDLGLVGQPKVISTKVLDSFEKSDVIPVIAPIGIGPDGETLNINADTAAGAIAAATRASRMYMLTDIEGVLDKDKNLISELKVSEAQAAIESGVISGGMIPKIETCIEAIQGGVDGAAIIDGRVAHTVLVELFTEGGAGTLITRG